MRKRSHATLSPSSKSKARPGAKALGASSWPSCCAGKVLNRHLTKLSRAGPTYTLELREQEKADRLLFNGHTDTIPIGSSRPPARDGDWIIGRGAEDMKGGLVAMVHAASALRKAGVELAGDLWLTGVIGHETPVGKKEGPKRLIQHLRDSTIRADAVVIVEGPCALWTASLGSTIFRVTITSSRGPIHTIKVPYAESPARWLGRLLSEFERLEQEFDCRHTASPLRAGATQHRDDRGRRLREPAAHVHTCHRHVAVDAGKNSGRYARDVAVCLRAAGGRVRFKL